MNIFHRFILGLYTFCIAVISFFVMLVAVEVISYDVVKFYLDSILLNKQFSVVLFIISILFFIVSLRFLLSGHSNSKEKNGIRKSSQHGNIIISLNSIQSIVNSVVKQIEGVIDTKIIVKNYKETVKVKLNVSVTPENNIPNLSENIQNKVKEAIEKIAGVGITTVEVFIDDVVQSMKSKIKTPTE